jgi:hypothetical protein
MPAAAPFMQGRSRPLALAVGGLAALALLMAVPGRAAAPMDKKVETQRIVVDPAKKPAPELHKGVEGLPPLVAKARERILAAAYSGDLAELKKVMQQNETLPSLSVNETGDPVDYLKSQSGDGEGREVLAILTDVMEAGYARVGAGTPAEMYVWPYFAAIPIEGLEPPQLVELYKIVTSSDYDEMKTANKYLFYTVGIGPDGTWHYFKIAD